MRTSLRGAISVWICLAVASCLPLSGCGDDSETAGGTSSGPLYIGSTRVFSAEGSNGYLFAVDSLDAGAEVDLAQAVELNDAWVFGDADPYFYTATIFEPTITRWSLSDSGRFEQGPTVSFQNQGVGGTYTAAFVPVFSSSKAYFVDAASGQVVVWNPADMEFVRTIEVPVDAEVPTGMSPIMDLALRDDRIFVSVFWVSQDSFFTEYADFARLVAIDPATDQVVEVRDEPRCQALAPSGVTSDGTAYFSPWDYHAAVRGVYGEGYGVDSCALRVVPPGNGFEEGYEVDLSELVGGRPAGGLTLISDEEALIHVWQDDLVHATPDDWQEKRFEAGYKWYRWTLGDAQATELPGQAPSSEGGSWLRMDGQVISFSPNADFSETTVVRLAPDGSFEPGVTVPGYMAALIRAR